MDADKDGFISSAECLGCARCISLYISKHLGSWTKWDLIAQVLHVTGRAGQAALIGEFLAKSVSALMPMTRILCFPVCFPKLMGYAGFVTLTSTTMVNCHERKLG